MTPTSRFLKKRRIPPVLAAAALVLLATLACTHGCIGSFLRGRTTNVSTVTLDSPADGSSVPVNTPIAVRATYTLHESGNSPQLDYFELAVVGAGLNISGIQVGAADPAQQTNVYTTTVTPTEVGELIIGVAGHDEFGSVRDASVTVQVVAESQVGDVGAQGAVGAQGVPGPQATCGNGVVEGTEVCDPPGGSCGPNEACNTATCQCESTGTVTANATASSDLNVRANPGPGCDVLSNVDTQTLVLDAKSSNEPFWYRIQGGGWVFGGALDDLNYQVVGDLNSLPVDNNAVGCLFCGDGVCSPEIDESAPTCEADCPAVCGDNFVTHTEVCDPPESEPAEPAYGESAVQWCNACAQVSTKEPPSEPPFDSSACGAACVEDSDCPAGFSCQPDPTGCSHPSC
jgi:hypothetical protein